MQNSSNNVKVKLVNTLFLFGIFISCFIFSPFVLDFTLTPRFITFSLFICLSLYFLSRTGFAFKVDIDFILLFYILYVLFCTALIFYSVNTAESLFEVCKLLLGLFAFLFTYFALKQSPDYFIHALLKFSVIVVFIGLAFACYQFAGLNKESLYLITGLNGHKNLYSSFLFLNLFFLVKTIYTLSKPWKIAAFITIFFTLVVIALLRTKAVWIGCGVALLASVALHLYASGKKKFAVQFYLVLIISVLIANVFFLFVLQPIISKGINYNAKIDPSLSSKKELDNERLILWDKSYGMFKKHPVIGVGPGNWQIHFPDQTLNGLWRAEDLNFTFQRPHNDLLWILCETGIIGFNLFLLFLFSLLLFLEKTLRLSAKGSEIGRNLILSISFIIGFFTISFFDFPKERMEHIIWINIIFGISYFYIKQNNFLRSIWHFTASKQSFNLPITLFLFLVVVGIFRYRGEFFTRKMYDHKNKGQNDQLILAAKKAQSFAYSIDPTSVPLLWYTGNAYASIGNYEQARWDFINARELNPYNRNVVNDLASSFTFNKEIFQAKKYYREASRISPRFDGPKLNLTAIYINEKNYKAADSCLKTLFHDSERRTNYQRMVDAFLLERR